MVKTLSIPLVLGAGSLGLEGATGARITGKTAGQDLVDAFLKTGGNTIDTAAVYAGGTSQKLLAQLDIKDAHIDTKIYPLQPGAHSPENLRASVKAAAEALAPHKINVLYLHAPDRSVPYVDIAREVNELHKEGLIREFGLSNFFAWEVAEFYFIADKNGWIRPTVYQGVYSVLERQAEQELFPLLKKLDIRFYGYSPLAGGILAGKDLGVATKDGSRFDSGVMGAFAQMFLDRYALLAKHGLSLPQVTFRWLQHHSKLEGPKGDAIVIGAFTLERLQQTQEWNEEGPLPDDLVKLVDALFQKNKGLLVNYSGA
ncbi:Aldo keto reductase [Mycena galopus ATCC 62051]|nr:Aldo keto reductase [Mycena galopus ATCC 62051]